VQQLKRASVHSTTIETVVISHLHADHCFGLPFLLMESLLQPRTQPLVIYGPRGLKELTSDLITLAYSELDPKKAFDVSQARFEVLVPYSRISIGKTSLHVFPMAHGSIQSFGFRYQKEDLNIALTCDTSWFDQLDSFFKDSCAAVVDATTESAQIPGHMNLSDVSRVKKLLPANAFLAAVHRSDAFTETKHEGILFPEDLDSFTISNDRWEQTSNNK